MRATYVLQTRYLADARGAKLVGPALARLVRAVRAGLRRRGRGRRRRGPAGDGAARRRAARSIRPTPRPSHRSTEVDGETLSGELRVSRYVLDELGAGAVEAFRGVSGSTPRGFAAVAEETGIDVDATLPVDAAGGAFPFWQAQADGLERRLLRFPVAVDDVPGEGPAAALAAAYVALRRNHGSGARHARRADARSPRLRRRGRAGTARRHAGGRLAGHARQPRGFWGERAGLALDARPLGAGRGWLVRLGSEGSAGGQSLVAPFRVARATGADGRPLRGTRRKPRRPARIAAARRRSSSFPRARRSTGRGIPPRSAFRQAATRLPRQLTLLSSSAHVCR